jgi:hypothetical protein
MDGIGFSTVCATTDEMAAQAAMHSTFCNTLWIFIRFPLS